MARRMRLRVVASAAAAIAVVAGPVPDACAQAEEEEAEPALADQLKGVLERNAALEERLDRQQMQIDELMAASGDNWLTEQRAEDIRALVTDVLADADTRASLMQSDMTSGYDNGFLISSADGNYSMKINGQLQARFVFNDQSNSPVDNTRWGFEMTRTKLWFSGHIVDPSWV